MKKHFKFVLCILCTLLLIFEMTSCTTLESYAEHIESRYETVHLDKEYLQYYVYNAPLSILEDKLDGVKAVLKGTRANNSFILIIECKSSSVAKDLASDLRLEIGDSRGIYKECIVARDERFVFLGDEKSVDFAMDK